MALMFSDGFEFRTGDEVSEWLEQNKQEFVDAVSYACVRCHCKTTISIPKGETVEMADLCCPVCKEVLLTSFVATHRVRNC
jgi:hypothetical protein